MNIRTNRSLFLVLAIASVASLVAVVMINGPYDRYLSTAPSVSQQFTAIPNEQSLVDLCYRLQNVQGVTGVSYRDYSMVTKSAVVTIFYNPHETSVRQLRIFLQHSRILWAEPART